jgi:hypothetical protein
MTIKPNIKYLNVSSRCVGAREKNLTVDGIHSKKTKEE